MVRLEEGLAEPSGQLYFDFGDGQEIVQKEGKAAEHDRGENEYDSLLRRSPTPHRLFPAGRP